MDKVQYASAFTCCYVCKKPARDKCGRCMVTRYCCLAHQHEDWQQHRRLCAWLQAELARRAALRERKKKEEGRGATPLSSRTGATTSSGKHNL